MYFCPLLHLEASSLSVLFVSIIKLVLLEEVLFVCLFKEAMLIWQCVPWILATTAREILMQSCPFAIQPVLYFSSLILYFTTLHPAFQNDCFDLFLALMGGVCHITTNQGFSSYIQWNLARQILVVSFVQILRYQSGASSPTVQMV